MFSSHVCTCTRMCKVVLRWPYGIPPSTCVSLGRLPATSLRSTSVSVGSEGGTPPRSVGAALGRHVWLRAGDSLSELRFLHLRNDWAAQHGLRRPRLTLRLLSSRRLASLQVGLFHVRISRVSAALVSELAAVLCRSCGGRGRAVMPPSPPAGMSSGASARAARLHTPSSCPPGRVSTFSLA